MNIKTILTTVFLVAAGAVGCTSLSSSVDSESDKGIRGTVAHFVQGADNKDKVQLSKTLHPSFRVVAAFKGSPKSFIMSREQYLKMLDAGKIGGVKRTVDIRSIDVYGNFALVHAKLTSPVLKFDARYSLIKENGVWTLIQDNALIEKIIK